MKLEYLPDGSPDCPLIRLYDFAPPAVVDLVANFDALATSLRNHIPLHEERGIVPVDGCQLFLRRHSNNEGVIARGPLSFECRLTPDGWSNVAALAQPFCSKTAATHYQWLNEDGPVSLLLSPTGRW